MPINIECLKDQSGVKIKPGEGPLTNQQILGIKRMALQIRLHCGIKSGACSKGCPLDKISFASNNVVREAIEEAEKSSMLQS